MTEQKKNVNPFVNLAKTAKKNIPDIKGKQGKPNKPPKGFSGPSVVRRSGRGG